MYDVLKINAPINEPSLIGTSVDITGNIDVDALITGDVGYTTQDATVELTLFKQTTTAADIENYDTGDILSSFSDTIDTSGDYTESGNLGDVIYGDSYIVALRAEASATTEGPTSVADLTDPSIFLSGLAPGSEITTLDNVDYNAPSPAPESSSLVSFGILVVLGSGLCAITRRRRQRS